MREYRNNVCNWFEETFGFAIIETQTYEEMQMSTILGGMESGYSTSKTVSGDVNKPVSFYATNGSDAWDLSQYKSGFQINISGGGFYYESGLLEFSIGFSNGNSSIEFIGGLNKMGYTQTHEVDFGNRSVGIYNHGYIRPWTLIAVFAVCYYGRGDLVGAMG